MTQAAETTLGVASPSGTVLHHTGGYSNWCSASELARVMKAIHASAVSYNQDWLGTHAKYLTICVDMRTGNFTLSDTRGERIDGNDEILAKFGLEKPRTGDLDSFPHQKTKYMIVKSKDNDTRSLVVYHSHLKALDLKVGDPWEEFILVGFADSLMHAQIHLHTSVIKVQKPK